MVVSGWPVGGLKCQKGGVVKVLELIISVLFTNIFVVCRTMTHWMALACHNNTQKAKIGNMMTSAHPPPLSLSLSLSYRNPF